MAATFKARRQQALQRELRVISLSIPPSPPSGALINAILEYADVQQSLGGDRVILRLSPRRIADPVIRELLGREAPRLAEVSILWDEAAGQIVKVMDEAEVEQERGWADEQESELDTFELTGAALAYIASYGRKKSK